MRRLLLILPLMLTVSCSSGTSSGIGALLTGSWIGDMISTNDLPTSPSGKITMTISQDIAGKLTGIITISDPETMCWSGGTLDETSSITGSRVTITFTDGGGASVAFDATATSTSIKGLYTSKGGTCASNSGTLSLVRA